jgi:hypothetical protein
VNRTIVTWACAWVLGCGGAAPPPVNETPEPPPPEDGALVLGCGRARAALPEGVALIPDESPECGDWPGIFGRRSEHRLRSGACELDLTFEEYVPEELFAPDQELSVMDRSELATTLGGAPQPTMVSREESEATGWVTSREGTRITLVFALDGGECDARSEATLTQLLMGLETIRTPNVRAPLYERDLALEVPEDMMLVADPRDGGYELRTRSRDAFATLRAQQTDEPAERAIDPGVLANVELEPIEAAEETLQCRGGVVSPDGRLELRVEVCARSAGPALDSIVRTIRAARFAAAP